MLSFRYYKFSEEGDLKIQDLIWELFQLHRDWHLKDFSNYLCDHGIDAADHFVARVFRLWQWSWKLPSRTQFHKYSPENLAYYFHYIKESYEYPWDRLKFADESHFVSRQLYRKKQLAPIGERAHAVNVDRLDSTALTLTLLTDLTKGDLCLFLRWVLFFVFLFFCFFFFFVRTNTMLNKIAAIAQSSRKAPHIYAD
jgi:hypothetical protein